MNQDPTLDSLENLEPPDQLAASQQARLQEFLRAGPVLWLLVKRDFHSRYAGSTLGMVWNLIHPIVLVGIYIIVFGSIMSDRAAGVSKLDYAVYLTSGIIPWLVFSEILGRCTSVLVDNGSFLQKVALPVEILHLSIAINTLIIHFFSLIALAIFLLIMGYHLPAQVLFAYPIMILLAIVAVGLGLVLSVLNLVLRDIGQFITIALQFGFWLTPIIYPMSILPEKLQTILRYNPLLPFITLVQDCFGAQNNAFPGMDGYHVIALLPFISMTIGILFLRKHRSELLDSL